MRRLALSILFGCVYTFVGFFLSLLVSFIACVVRGANFDIRYAMPICIRAGCLMGGVGLLLFMFYLPGRRR